MRSEGVTVNDSLDISEVIDAAGNGDGSVVLKSELLLRLVQQPHEERVLQILHGHLESVLLLRFPPHPYPHPPFRRHRRRRTLSLLMPMLVAQVRRVEVKP